MSQPEMMTVRLVRPESSVPWGFRLQGGSDFSTALSIQSVSPNSVAERSGLRAGDGVIYINDANTDTLSHEEAKSHIIRSGNDIYLTVQRGAVSIWAPKVTPMSQLRPQEMRTIKTSTGDEVQAVQKTSLARSHQPEPLKIGSGYNRTPRSFAQAPQSPKKPVPNVVHAQFNSPIGLYSAGNIADSYQMQTAGIQKEMENLDVANSPVGTRMTGTYQRVDSTDESTPGGFRSVRAPDPQPISPQQQQQGNMHCGECGNMVMGVFVKVRGIPYHAQCFKCTSCGINLKQKGYFVIDDKLYCEIHAKRVAQPPDPNMKAVPVYR